MTHGSHVLATTRNQPSLKSRCNQPRPDSTESRSYPSNFCRSKARSLEFISSHSTSRPHCPTKAPLISRAMSTSMQQGNRLGNQLEPRHMSSEDGIKLLINGHQHNKSFVFVMARVYCGPVLEHPETLNPLQTPHRHPPGCQHSNTRKYSPHPVNKPHDDSILTYACVQNFPSQELLQSRPGRQLLPNRRPSPPYEARVQHKTRPTEWGPLDKELPLRSSRLC